MQTLVAAGADVDVKNEHGMTAADSVGRWRYDMSEDAKQEIQKVFEERKVKESVVRKWKTLTSK